MEEIILNDQLKDDESIGNSNSNYNLDTVNVALQELTLPEKFISPNYSTKSDNSVPDLRATIYWNPNIITNRKGRAKIAFYNSDRARNLQICIEGITKDGMPIFDIYDIGRNANQR